MKVVNLNKPKYSYLKRIIAKYVSGKDADRLYGELEVYMNEVVQRFIELNQGETETVINAINDFGNRIDRTLEDQNSETNRLLKELILAVKKSPE